MNRIFKFEMHKLFSKKSFYVCMTLAIALYVIITVSTSLLTKSLGADFPSGLAGSLPQVIELGMVPLMMGIFTTLYVTEDFSDHVMKNIVARGFSRNSIFLVKYLASTISAVVMACVMIVVAVITNVVLGGPASISSLVPFMLFAQIIALIAANTLYFAVGMVFRKSGVALAFIFLVPTIIAMVLQFLPPSLVDKLPFRPAEYWLDNLLASISNAGDFMGIVKYLVAAVVYIVVFWCVGNALFQKQDY